VASIKSAAEKGHTVLLTNGDAISSSIFDLLNKVLEASNAQRGYGVTGSTAPPLQHHTRVPEMSREGRPTGNLAFYANIAIGSFSRPCKVDGAFRLVIHLPLSAVAKTPLPFLNRLEKYTLSLQVGSHTRRERVEAGCISL
jgi:hypothetical protein